MLRKQRRFSKELYQTFLRQNVISMHSKYTLNTLINIRTDSSISDRIYYKKSASHFHTNANGHHNRKNCHCHSCYQHHHKSHFHSSPHLHEQAQLQKEESETQIIEQMDERTNVVEQTEETRNSKIDAIVDEISKLNLLEVATLVTALKSKLNLPDTAMMGSAMPMAAMPAAAATTGGATEEAEPEIVQTIFDVVLKSFPADKKVSIIKEVRGIYKLGLKEAKALVEKAPCTLQAQAPKVEAEEVKEKLEAFGAEIQLD